MKNKTQVEICNTLGLSRATVSRMLALGREQGIVKIEVINPISYDYGELEQKLEQRFGLKEAIIVESEPLEMCIRDSLYSMRHGGSAMNWQRKRERLR